MKFIPELRGSERTRFDSLGFLRFGSDDLITIAMEAGECICRTARDVAASLASPVCRVLAARGHIEIRCSHRPVQDPHIAVGILGNLFARLGSGALPFLVPLLLQVALGYSPSQAGMSMLPLAAAAMIAKWVARPLIERLGYRIVLTGNTLLLGIMLASMGLVSEQTPYWLLLCLLAILGAINSLQFTAMNTVTLIDLDDASASSGNSLLSVVAQLSLSLGVACAGALLGGFTAEVGNDGVETVLGAFQLTFVTVGIMAMLAATIFSQLSKEDGRRAKRPQEHIEH